MRVEKSYPFWTEFIKSNENVAKFHHRPCDEVDSAMRIRGMALLGNTLFKMSETLNLPSSSEV